MNFNLAFAKAGLEVKRRYPQKTCARQMAVRALVESDLITIKTVGFEHVKYVSYDFTEAKPSISK